MKLSEKFSSFDKIKAHLEKKALDVEQKNPLKRVKSNPKVGYETKNIKKTFFLRLKGILYLIRQDKNLKLFRKYLLKRPFFYSFNLLKSLFRKKNYYTDGNHFFFNLKSFNDLKKCAINKKSLFVFGFSYCMKPIECPKKRFSSDCINDPKNLVCSQCFISKCKNLMQKDDISLVIPDTYYIGEKLLEIEKKNPNKEIVFVIITCHFAIDMFSDFSNMLNLKGSAIKLGGRVCINYKSFLFAEMGKKPSLTNIEDIDQLKLMEILNLRWSL
ncbi:MAG: hypothetical protein K940chlam1_00946 [Candidatus Anoxychlamydiales bacterium]|nr:hypothetical protein [Candidatus Anoxychlamydiales bacterium]NGX35576.1 hypothetical protein [Candidatus Anoxychlamydiales bacterium]